MAASLTKTPAKFAGGKGPRQMIWEAVRECAASSEIFSVDDVWLAVPRSSRPIISDNVMNSYLKALVTAGVLLLKCPKPRKYTLVNDEGMEAPKVRADGSRATYGLAQEQMWRTLRLLSSGVTVKELAANASTRALTVQLSAVTNYLAWLKKAGYVTSSKRAGSECFRLKAGRNTGPRPPSVCTVRVVYDPNEDKVVWSPNISDEDAVHD